MFLTIIKKDLLKDLLNIKLALMLVMCCVLIPLSFAIATTGYQQRMIEYQKRHTAGDKVPMPHALGIVAEGIDAQQFGNGFKGYTTGNQTPDPLFMVRVVISLLAILLGAGALSDEWSGGITRIIFAGPVNKSMFILARMCSGFISVLYPFFAGCALGIVVMLLMNVSFTPGEWVRLAFCICMFSLYLCVLYAMGLAASVFTASGAVASYLALALWAVAVLVLPQAGTAAIVRMIPAPSLQQAQMEKGRIREETANRQGGGIAYGTEEEKRRCREVDLRRLGLIDRQAALVRTTVGFTPGGALIVATTELAQTGFGFYRDVLKPVLLEEEPAISSEGNVRRTLRGAMIPCAVLNLTILLFLVLSYMAFTRREMARS